jgi:hypothetical protein
MSPILWEKISRLLPRAVSLSVTRFATASGCALNFSAQTGASAATTAFSASPFASFRVVSRRFYSRSTASTVEGNLTLDIGLLLLFRVSGIRGSRLAEERPAGR